MCLLKFFLDFQRVFQKVIGVEVTSRQTQQSVPFLIVFYSSTNTFGLQFTFGKCMQFSLINGKFQLHAALLGEITRLLQE